MYKGYPFWLHPFMDMIQHVHNFITNKVYFHHKCFSFWLNTKKQIKQYHRKTPAMIIMPIILKHSACLTV